MIFPLWNSNSPERSVSSCYPSAKVHSIKDSYFRTSLEHISTAEGIKKHCTKVQLIHRNFLANMYYFCTFISSNKVFHNFSFFFISIVLFQSIFCTLQFSVFTCHIFIIFFNVNPTKKSYFSWLELVEFITANQLCE